MFRSKFIVTRFIGEGESNTENSDGGANNSSGGGSGGNVDYKAEFEKSQAEIKRVRELAQRQNTEFEGLKSKLNLTKEEKENYEKQANTYRQELYTAEELAKQNHEKLMNETNEKIDSLTKESEKWKNKFSSNMISRSLVDAAVEHDAFAPAQIVAMLERQTTIEQKRDKEGNLLDDWETIVNYNTVDKNGKPITLKLSPKEAVKAMSEDKNYFNLFKSAAKGGFNSFTNPNGSGTPNAAKLAETNPEEYRRLRREGKLSLGK